MSSYIKNNLDLVAEVHKNQAQMDAYMSMRWNRGFKISFANGYSLSVQWHQGAYCKHLKPIDDGRDSIHGEAESVEIAVMNTKGEITDMVLPDLMDMDTVAGWVPIDQLPLIMLRVQAYQPE